MCVITVISSESLKLKIIRIDKSKYCFLILKMFVKVVLKKFRRSCLENSLSISVSERPPRGGWPGLQVPGQPQLLPLLSTLGLVWGGGNLVPDTFNTNFLTDEE